MPCPFQPDKPCALAGSRKCRAPSCLSTVFVAIFGLGVLKTTLILLLRLTTHRQITNQERTVLVMVLLLQVTGFGLYVLHYRKCAPWTGWFLFFVTATAGDILRSTLCTAQSTCPMVT